MATRFTVVLPTHNGGDLLRKSLESVLAQDADFTLHVIDDGHAPQTGEIVRALGDARVRYTLLRDAPLFRKLNFGMESATTEWVKIWSDDDVMLPGCLGAHGEFLARNPGVGLVYCDYEAIDAAGQPYPLNALRREQLHVIPEVATSREALLVFWTLGCTPSNICSVALRRSDWREAGPFDERMEMAADFEMWVRIAERASVGFIRERLVKVRIHEGQLSKSMRMLPKNIAETATVVRRLEEDLREVVSAREAAAFWYRDRGRAFFHAAVRAAAAGYLKEAVGVLGAVKRFGPVTPAALLWAVTLNGRLMPVDRVRLFREKARRIDAGVLPLSADPRSDMRTTTNGHG